MNIYETICKVMEDVGAVTKSKENKSGQKFMYRGIDDVMNALNPAMVKSKLFVVPEVLEQTREDRISSGGSKLIYSICKIRYTFYAEDGSNIQATVIGEAFDSGDKATNKAMSVAFKYACFQVFCIPTEEMKDPDAESHQLAPKTYYKNSGNQSNAAEEKKDQEETKRVLALKIDHLKINVINSEIARTGISENAIFDRYHIEKLEDMTEEMFGRAMKAFEVMKDKV